MTTYNSTVVKAIPSIRENPVIYFESLTDCCNEYGIRYESSLQKLIEQGGLSPDGMTFFDYPTDEELEDIRQGKITLVGTSRKRR